MFEHKNIDTSALLSKPSSFAILRTRRSLDIAIPFFQTNNKKHFTPGSLSEHELEYVTRTQLFCTANALSFIAHLSGVFPEPRSRFTTQWNNRDFRMIVYAFVVSLSPQEWFELGEYRVGEGAKKNPPYGNYATYVRVSIQKPLPSIVINSRSIGSKFIDHGDLERYETESSEFNQLFELYIDTSRVHDTLTILSPDVMAELIDFYVNYDIEIDNGRIFAMTTQIDFTRTGSFSEFTNHIEALTAMLSRKIRQTPTTTPFDPIQPNAATLAGSLQGTSEATTKNDIALALALSIGFVLISTALSFILLTR